MAKHLFFLFILLAPFAISAQETSKSVEQFIDGLDQKVPQLLKDFNVPGTAIGIIENGEIVLQKGYGLADVDKGTKVTSKTGFNIGSVSKTIAAWGVMKLVQEGKLNLDDPAEKYLTRWHLPDSEFDADGVTIGRMLSHTAGLSLHGYPGWSPKDTLSTVEESLNGRNNGPGRVEIITEPGTNYKYSGGGYTILQLIVEEVTGQKFEDYMQKEVLNPLGMTNSSYKIDEKIMAASASGHDKFGEVIDFELFTAQAAAGLHVTIEDFTRFALANLYGNKDFEKYNTVLKGDHIKQMMKAVPQAQGRYGYGLGYFVESLPNSTTILNGHRGANTGWHAIFDVNTETNDGFIMVTNGGSGHQVYSPILYDWVLWKLGIQLEDWHNSKPTIGSQIKTVIDKVGIADIAAVYKGLKENHPDKYDFAEDKLNQLGYHYLSRGDTEKSVAVFKLNAEVFPESFNVYDSYGEALLANGDKEAGIESYKKSIKLNPGNEHGIKVLNDLGVSIDDLIYKVPMEHLKLLSGEYTMLYDPGWTISFEIENGELIGYDPESRFRMLPTDKNEFMNPDGAYPASFDTEDPNSIRLLLGKKYKFRKTGVSKPSIARKLLNVIDSVGIDNIEAVYWDLRKNQADTYDFSELQLNALGYHFIGERDLGKAMKILKLNIDAFPNAYNVYDSYGEVLLEQARREDAIKNYKKSVALNPGNLHGIDVLKRLGVSTEDMIIKIPAERLQVLAGEYVMTEEEDWKLKFQVINDKLMGKDGEYQFELTPTGDNKFIIPINGDSWVFDIKDENAISLVFSEKYKFKKVK